MSQVTGQLSVPSPPSGSLVVTERFCGPAAALPLQFTVSEVTLPGATEPLPSTALSEPDSPLGAPMVRVAVPGLAIWITPGVAGTPWRGHEVDRRALDGGVASTSAPAIVQLRL